MLDQSVDEVYGREGFFHIFVILMAVVMKGNRVIFSIVLINTGSVNDRPAEITVNVFDHLFGLTAVGFCHARNRFCPERLRKEGSGYGDSISNPCQKCEGQG